MIRAERGALMLPSAEDELADHGLLSTAGVIADLKFWQRYLIYAVCGMAFLIWLMLMSGPRKGD